MKRLALSLAAAVLGSGCIVTTDGTSGTGGSQMVDITWDFYRYAPAQTGGWLVYDASLVGQTGSCVQAGVDTVTVDSPSLAAPITVSCVHMGVQGVRTPLVATGATTFTLTGKRGNTTVFQTSDTIDVGPYCDAQDNCNPVTFHLTGVHAPFELWTYFQAGATPLGTCSAAGFPTVTYTISDVFDNVIAQSAGGVQCASGATPLLVLDASDTSPSADIGDLDLDTYHVAVAGFVTGDPNNAPTYAYSCPVSIDHFASQTGVAAPPFTLNTTPMTCP